MSKKRVKKRKKDALKSKKRKIRVDFGFDIEPRLVRRLTGEWRIEEWWVLVAPCGKEEHAPLGPVMFSRRKRIVAKEWQKGEHCGRGFVRPVRMLVSATFPLYGIPMLDAQGVGDGMSLLPFHFEHGFPRAQWETY